MRLQQVKCMPGDIKCLPTWKMYIVPDLYYNVTYTGMANLLDSQL